MPPSIQSEIIHEFSQCPTHCLAKKTVILDLDVLTDFDGKQYLLTIQIQLSLKRSNSMRAVFPRAYPNVTSAIQTSS